MVFLPDTGWSPGLILSLTSVSLLKPTNCYKSHSLLQGLSGWPSSLTENSFAIILMDDNSLVHYSSKVKCYIETVALTVSNQCYKKKK